MSDPFAHPSSDKLLGSFFDLFQYERIFQRKDRHIVFLCGGPVKAKSRSMRYRFLKFSKYRLPNFRLFLAESATKDLTQHGEPEFVNLADFESVIGEIADCIVIFVESPGSIAELGFFVHNPKTLKKLLVVNDMNRQKKDSFINVGLVDKINSKSLFKPVILTRVKDPDFSFVEQRLESRLPVKTGKRFEHKKFSKLTPRERLFVVFQTIFVMRALRFDSVKYCINRVFGYANEKKLRHLLSILIAIEYVERKGESPEYFVPRKKAEPFLDFRNMNRMHAAVADYFREHHRETYNILGEVAN
jgi:hypothetical protein